MMIMTMPSLNRAITHYRCQIRRIWHSVLFCKLCVTHRRSRRQNINESAKVLIVRLNVGLQWWFLQEGLLTPTAQRSPCERETRIIPIGVGAFRPEFYGNGIAPCQNVYTVRYYAVDRATNVLLEVFRQWNFVADF